MSEIINHGICKSCKKNNCYSYNKFKMIYCNKECYRKYINKENYKGEFVYIIIDPLNKQIKYVGSTQNINMRKTKNPAYVYSKQSKKLKEYMNDLINKQIQPIFEIIDQCKNKKERFKQEQFYIDYFRFIGADLLNTLPAR